MNDNQKSDCHGIKEAQILSVMDAVYPLLRHSEWAPALNINGIDILEVMRSPVYTSLLGEARDNASERIKACGLDSVYPSSNRHVKIPGFVRRRSWPRIVRELRAALSSGKPRNIQVVFWPREPTHIKAQAPVFKELQTMGVRSCFFTSNIKIFEQLRALGYSRFFAITNMLGRLRDMRKAQNISQTLSVNPLPVSSAFYSPRGRLMKILSETLTIQYETISKAIQDFDMMARKISPCILVVGNDLTPEGRTACLRAKTQNMRTVCLMHGSVDGPLHRYHVADVFMVYGEAHRRQLIARGVESGRLKVSGAPYLDACPKQSGRIGDEIQKKLNLSENRPYILVATSGPGDSVSHHHHFEIIHSIIRLSAKFPEFDFVAKLHRKDHLEHYENAAKAAPESNLRVVPYGTAGLPDSIFDWLQGCKLLLTGASTTAIEAMLLEVPVVTMDFADEIHHVDFIDKKATVHVKSLRELEAAVLSHIRNTRDPNEIDRNVKAYLKDCFHSLDGKAAHRCAMGIRSMIR